MISLVNKYYFFKIMSLKINDKLPLFTLKNQYNLEVNSKELYGQNVVIFFYPKDNTPGCTAQVCNFRDNFDTIEKYEANLIGISSDTVNSHNLFAKKLNIKYDLLSDYDRKVEKLFGVPRNLFGLLPGRVTYIFNKRGLLVETINSQTKINKHLNKSLEVLKRLKNTK